jgi:N4-(beta-N-acetylglucosaminyl)-L-asparaginase
MAVPLILSTWSFGKRGNDAAWPGLAAGGTSIDAVERVCQIVDADPQVDSVGFGGLPDAAGRVSLDGCIMLGPNRCGSVCFVRRYMHPVSIARKVMELTPHVMLAGEGAEAFAEQQGFMPADLLSADAQDAYRRWKTEHGGQGVVDQSRDRTWQGIRPIDHGTESSGGRLFLHRDDSAPQPAPSTVLSPGTTPHAHDGLPISGLPDSEDRWKHHDTVGVLAMDMHGVLAGGCSTSGTPFKLPGRVGDSPIIGHGVYVDPSIGAVVATGTGELIMGVCGSFLAVEFMRRGASPLDAICLTLRRIIENFKLRDDHQVAFVALRSDGMHASAALRPGFKVSMTWAKQSIVSEPDAVELPGP